MPCSRENSIRAPAGPPRILSGSFSSSGNLHFHFEAVFNHLLDDKKHRVAKLKGNKIFVQISARRLPKSALRYIIAHEIAHSLTRRHTKRFWKIVEAIYPGYEMGQSLLMEYGIELGN
jgi:hypothetical protein